MPIGRVQVLVAIFDDVNRAGEAHEELRSTDRQGTLEFVDSAVVVRRLDGRICIGRATISGARSWAGRVSAIVGGVGGGILGKVGEKGFDHSELKRVAESLRPGACAIMAIAEDHVIQRLHCRIADSQMLAL
jgi:uncharacterized membrane protein